jgi:hypothetical protein
MRKSAESPMSCRTDRRSTRAPTSDASPWFGGLRRRKAWADAQRLVVLELLCGLLHGIAPLTPLGTCGGYKLSVSLASVSGMRHTSRVFPLKIEHLMVSVDRKREIRITKRYSDDKV